MTNIKRYLIVAAAAFILGSAAAGTGMYFIMRPSSKNLAPGDVSTIIKSSSKGSLLKFSNWNFKGKTITFDTEAKGSLKGTTAINKDKIPEVHRWNTWVNALGFDYYGMYYGSQYHSWIGASYYYRWNFAALGGGIMVEPGYFKRGEKGTIPIAFHIGIQGWFGTR